MSNKQYNINIEYLCDCAEIAKQGFIRLVEELFRYSLANEEQFLTYIWIVPDGEIAQNVRSLIETSDIKGEYMQGETYHAKGVAVPILIKGKLQCHVLIELQLLLKIEALDQYHPQELVSTVLEEFLHVRLYGSQAHLIVKTADNKSCYSGINNLCTMFHDEFAVSAMKSVILASEKLTDYNGELITGSVLYGVRIPPVLDNAFTKLRDTINGGASGDMSISDAYDKVLQIVYRDIFEHLARDMGFRTSLPEAPHSSGSPLESWFFREHILFFWEKIQKLLRHSLESGFSQYEVVITGLVDIFDQFLKYIHVFLKTKPDGSCWVDMDSSFFDTMS